MSKRKLGSDTESKPKSQEREYEETLVRSRGSGAYTGSRSACLSTTWIGGYGGPNLDGGWILDLGPLQTLCQSGRHTSGSSRRGPVSNEAGLYRGASNTIAIRGSTSLGDESPDEFCSGGSRFLFCGSLGVSGAQRCRTAGSRRTPESTHQLLYSRDAAGDRRRSSESDPHGGESCSRLYGDSRCTRDALGSKSDSSTRTDRRTSTGYLYEWRAAKGFLVLFLALFSSPSFAQSLNLEDVLRLSVESHPELEGADADVAIARANRASTRASYGPSLKAAASVQVWNDAIEMNLAEGIPPLPEPSNEYEALISGFLNSGTVSIRDQVTWDASLTITQPLSPLWDVYLAAQVRELDVSIAKTQNDALTRRIQKDAVVAYWQVVQAKKSLEVAEASVAELESQASRLQTLVELGAAQNVDKLRLDVALAAAKKSVFEAEANVSLSLSALSVAMGRASMPGLDVAAIEPSEMLAPETDINTLVDEALRNREELKSLEQNIQQADLGVGLERANYYPDVVALAQAKHAQGQGLAGENTFFVGAAMEWTFFEWGRTSRAVDAAEATSIKVKAARTQAQHQIGLQIRKAWFDYVAAQKGYEVAGVAATQAEEAYRVETERFEAGQTAATDLLSAQTALTEARNNRDAAFYQALVHRSELIWALGRPLTRKNLVEGSLR